MALLPLTMGSGAGLLYLRWGQPSPNHFFWFPKFTWKFYFVIPTTGVLSFASMPKCKVILCVTLQVVLSGISQGLSIPIPYTFYIWDLQFSSYKGTIFPVLTNHWQILKTISHTFQEKLSCEMISISGKGRALTTKVRVDVHLRKNLCIAPETGINLVKSNANLPYWPRSHWTSLPITQCLHCKRLEHFRKRNQESVVIREKYQEDLCYSKDRLQ